MFSRHRKAQGRAAQDLGQRDPQEIPSVTDATLAGAGALASQPFRMDPFLGYVVHEQSGYSAMLEVSGKLTVYAPGGRSAAFDLRTMRPGQWGHLVHGGHVLPLQVYLNGTDVVGRWVFSGDQASDAAPDVTGQPYADTATREFWKPRNDTDRAADARLLEDLQRTRHGTAMQQISEIRY